MHYLLSSIRNKLLLICGGGTLLLLVAASVGLALQRQAVATMSGEVMTIEKAICIHEEDSGLLISWLIIAFIPWLSLGLIPAPG